MQKHVIEGPGGTKTLPSGTPGLDTEFHAALNTNEALHWALHYPTSYQSNLSKRWLKQNYTTDNIEKIRKMLAKKKQSYQMAG